MWIMKRLEMNYSNVFDQERICNGLNSIKIIKEPREDWWICVNVSWIHFTQLIWDNKDEPFFVAPKIVNNNRDKVSPYIMFGGINIDAQVFAMLVKLSENSYEKSLSEWLFHVNEWIRLIKNSKKRKYDAYGMYNPIPEWPQMTGFEFIDYVFKNRIITDEKQLIEIRKRNQKYGV